MVDSNEKLDMRVGQPSESQPSEATKDSQSQTNNNSES